jgi:RHS repeat-associated protein
MTAYVYDSQGNRVGKGSITTLSCNESTNGFVASAGYVTGLHGEQMTETNGTGQWAHTNVFANGSLIATYHDTNLYFAFEDWLGTKRGEGEAMSGGATCLNTYYSLPFGNDLTTTGACADATEHHFTGKERDAESGNDYFGARYFASSMGRFMSPDWNAKAQPVPYAKLDNPQSLNLYSYVLNNPLTGRDPDGHVCIFGIGNTCTPAPPAPPPVTPAPAPTPKPVAAPKPNPPAPTPNPPAPPGVPLAGILYPGANAAAQALKAAVNNPGPETPPPALIPSGPVVQPPVEETPMQQLVRLLGDALSNAADMNDTLTDIIPPMYIAPTLNPNYCGASNPNCSS